MMSPPDNISSRDQALLRYADDRLDVEDRATVHQLLQEAPDDAQRVREWRSHIDALRLHYDDIAHAPVPEHLLRAARRASRASPLRYAASIGWLLLGGLLGFGIAALQQQQEVAPRAEPSLPREAAIAHATYAPEIRHPVEVGAEQETHLVNWLSKRLGKPLRIPQLGLLGFNLVGGRLLPGDAGPVAQFMYQDANGLRLTLYVSTQTGELRETSFQFSQSGRLGVFYWLDHELGYALSGEIERHRLLQIAQTVYKQLNP